MIPLIVGAVGAGIAAISGIANAVSSSNAAKKQQASMDKTSKLAEQQMQFMQDQMQQWNSVFGDTQALLADYYKNLTPEKRIAQGFETLEDQYNKTSKRVNETLAQRGLAGGGADAQVNADLLTNLANQKAQVSQNAASQVAAEQAQFLNMGIQQKNALIAGTQNAYNSAMGVSNNAATAFGNMATAARQNAASALGSIGDVMGSAAALGMKQQELDILGGGGKTTAAATTSSSSQNLLPDYLKNTNQNLVWPENKTTGIDDLKPLWRGGALPIA